MPGASHRLPLLEVIKQTFPLLIATTAAWETHLFLEPTVLLLGRSGGLITTLFFSSASGH